jgi:hypothetical protein
MKLLLTLFLCTALVPAGAPGQPAEVHLYHVGHTGATASRFMLELPGSVTYLGETWAVPVFIGNAISGVSLAYGGCMPAPTYLGVVNIWVINPEVVCTDFRIVADPAAPSGQTEAVDCSSVVTYGYYNQFLIDSDPCRVNPPADLQPPDGAIGISLNPTLTWTWEPNTNCPEGIGLVAYEVYLGAAGGDLEKVGGVVDPQGTPQLTVGPLDPVMVYQWRVKVVDSYWECPVNTAWSPVHSFSTGGTVPAEQTSWGRIKSLYH